jgi:hypothetical protein
MHSHAVQLLVVVNDKYLDFCVLLRIPMFLQMPRPAVPVGLHTLDAVAWTFTCNCSRVVEPGDCLV